MSYDVYFEIDTESGNFSEVAERNYTSNVGKMWARALRNEGQHVGPPFPQFDYGLAGVIREHPSARELGPIISAAVKRMEEMGREAFLVEEEWCNGWGSYQGALEYLQWIARMCERHPDCTVRVSC